MLLAVTVTAALLVLAGPVSVKFFSCEKTTTQASRGTKTKDTRSPDLDENPDSETTGRRKAAKTTLPVVL